MFISNVSGAAKIFPQGFRARKVNDSVTGTSDTTEVGAVEPLAEFKDHRPA